MSNLPQIAPQGNLTIADTTIHMVDGLYSLNDLHRASGGLKKYKPSNFMRNEETIALINEIDNENSDAQIRASQAFKVIKGNFADGTKQGTYVCKELVYRYAMWISPKFSLIVIRTFDNLVQGQIMENYTLIDQFNKALLELDKNAPQFGGALIFKKDIDKFFCLLENIRKGARNTITNSVVATPSDFLLSILSVMGKMNLSVKTVARLFACYEHLVHPFFVKGKISQTGVLANV